MGSGFIKLNSRSIKFTCNICFSNGLQSVIQLMMALAVTSVIAQAGSGSLC